MCGKIFKVAKPNKNYNPLDYRTVRKAEKSGKEQQQIPRKNRIRIWEIIYKESQETR